MLLFALSGLVSVNGSMSSKIRINIFVKTGTELNIQISVFINLGFFPLLVKICGR
jgi:hypothetical protein